MLAVDINRKGVKGIDWLSPLARQYKLKSIPHFQIYDGDGNLIKEGQEAYVEIIADACRRRHPHVNFFGICEQCFKFVKGDESWK